MSIRRVLGQLAPKGVYRWYEHYRGASTLARLPSAPKVRRKLKTADRSSLQPCFSDSRVEEAWYQLESRIKGSPITSAAGGVNLGDRRALFHLIHWLQPARILEVGTHIGASTVYLSSALQSHAGSTPIQDRSLVTVDIVDVNDSVTRPWLNFGCPMSPLELLRGLKLDSQVQFVAQPSLDFLKQTSETFDFIFLDGDHRASTVYQEVPAALNCLRDGGAILLHDYYPGGKPLGDKGLAIAGPYLALRRLLAEYDSIAVLPLGEFPWETKNGSRFTSLALIVGK